MIEACIQCGGGGQVLTSGDDGTKPAWLSCPNCGGSGRLLTADEYEVSTVVVDGAELQALVEYLDQLPVPSRWGKRSGRLTGVWEVYAVVTGKGAAEALRDDLKAALGLTALYIRTAGSNRLT